jgi:hypothetical protein
MTYLQAFLHFKRKPKGTPLTYDSGDDDGLPIMNIFGEQVLCEGQQCTSALSVLHKTRRHVGAYQERCEKCADLNHDRTANDLHVGDMHSAGANLFRMGNPTLDEIYKNTTKQQMKDGHDYEPYGASQLLPKDVRRLRRRLLASNNIVGLETYTMVIMGIKCFLRPDGW